MLSPTAHYPAASRDGVDAADRWVERDRGRLPEVRAHDLYVLRPERLREATTPRERAG